MVYCFHSKAKLLLFPLISSGHVYLELVKFKHKVQVIELHPSISDRRVHVFALPHKNYVTELQMNRFSVHEKLNGWICGLHLVLINLIFSTSIYFEVRNSWQLIFNHFSSLVFILCDNCECKNLFHLGLVAKSINMECSRLKPLLSPPLIMHYIFIILGGNLLYMIIVG